MNAPNPHVGRTPEADRTWCPPPVRAAGLLALAVGLVAAAGPARGGPIVPKFTGTDDNFIVGTVSHGAVNASATHKTTVTAKDGKKEVGRLTFEIKERDGKGKFPDTVEIVSGTTQHVGNPKRGELPGDGRTFVPNPGALPFGEDLGRVVTAHGKEFDYAYGRFTAFPDVKNEKEMIGYTITYNGWHVDAARLKRLTGLGAGLKSDDPSSEAFGGAALLLDTGTGEFGLALSVLGVAPAEIDAATIRLGTPSAPGDVIYDLDPMAFEDLDGLGAGRNITDGLFSAADLDEVAAGRSYIEIVAGSEVLTGRLLPAAVPEPSSAVLLGAGTALLAYARRFRRAGVGHPAGS
ncbi:MAG: PEP-CTERM sorting domain-containing protein [Gemmataceae bacterium]|nr:PEP-CTERM sorting domain-containing protein [Gemmataceae bacterium]